MENDACRVARVRVEARIQDPFPDVALAVEQKPDQSPDVALAAGQKPDQSPDAEEAAPEAAAPAVPKVTPAEASDREVYKVSRTSHCRPR